MKDVKIIKCTDDQILSIGHVGTYIKCLRDHTSVSCGGGQYIFRGVPALSSDEYVDDIESGAARRLRDANKTSQREFIDYHTELIHQARHNRHRLHREGLYDVTKLHDLEILAELQHYGAATCLIDFTTNFLIALFFASAKPEKQAVRNSGGRVFIVDLLHTPNDEFFYINNLKADDRIEDLLIKRTKRLDDMGKDSQPRIWVWRPSKLNNRIRRQGSVFLFTLAKVTNDCEPKKGDENICYWTLEVNENHKVPLRKELEMYFGLSSETVFDDLEGFAAKVHGAKSQMVGELSSTMTCLAQGKQCYKQGRYIPAINYFTEAIKCCEQKRGECNKRPTLAPCDGGFENEAHYRRGLSHCQLGDDQENSGGHRYYAARKDFESVCNSMPKSKPSENDKNNLFKKAYRYQITTYYSVKDFKGALKCCHKYRDSKHLADETLEHRFLALEITELAFLLNDKDEFCSAWRESYKYVGKSKLTNFALMVTFFGIVGKLLFGLKCPEWEKNYCPLSDYERFEPLAHWNFCDLEWAIDHASPGSPLDKNQFRLREEIARAKSMQDELLELRVIGVEPFL